MSSFQIVLIEKDGVLDIYDGPWNVLRYRYFGPKPYVSHLLAPNSAVPGLSKSVIQDSPADHLHHHGIWWGQDEIKGTEFWLENNTSGRINHVEFDVIVTKETYASFACVSTWESNDGRVCAKDYRTFKVSRPSDQEPGWVLDIDYKIVPVEEPITLMKVVDSGFPAFRVADIIDVFDGGHLVDDNGIEFLFDPPTNSSKWMVAWGKIDGSPPALSSYGGLAVLDHPLNPGYPNTWFTRPFGWFTPFGSQSGERVVPLEGINLKHRVVTFRGEHDHDRIDKQWNEFILNEKQ